MRSRNFLNLKYLLGSVLAIMALVAFNLGQPPITSDLADDFNNWYQATTVRLSPSAELRDADFALQITISVHHRDREAIPTVWNVPSSSLRDPRERESTARVLQLIRESDVFGLTSLHSYDKNSPRISITAKDKDHEFSVTLPYTAVEQSIQLQNLLKLLEVTANQNASPIVDPARL